MQLLGELLIDIHKTSDKVLKCSEHRLHNKCLALFALDIWQSLEWMILHDDDDADWLTLLLYFHKHNQSLSEVIHLIEKQGIFSILGASQMLTETVPSSILNLSDIMSELFTWKASVRTSPTQSDGTISAFLLFSAQ